MLRIRSEAAGDVAGIRTVHRSAFATSAESELVDAIRASARFRPEYSVVAETDEGIVGHALLSHAELVAGDVARPVAVLAPIAVLPAYQYRGAGTAMMHECIGRADHAGEPLIVLVGHPGYYPRFGFVPASRYGITPPDPLPDAVFMARRLSGYDPAWRGRLVYPAAFDVVRQDLERPPGPATPA
ncbi:MAG: N-acetyltransferase [Deinococcales bacterium]